MWERVTRFPRFFCPWRGETLNKRADERYGPMLQENTIIDNHYQLKQRIGRGSFGEVWLATDTYLGHDVALKFYVAMDNNGRQEFRDEYLKVYRLKHNNLLTPSHYAEWNDQPYLELEYCPASAAAQLGQIDEPTLWRFIADVAAGMAYMHATVPPLVHQDIKPANILQKADGHYAITDFGISVSLRSTMLRQSGREATNSVGGSIPYMGPELFGAKPVPIMASDVWALGVTIYEMATGTLPFMGQGGIMLKNGADLPVLEGFSPDLNSLMQSCLAKEPWDRPTAAKIVEQAAQHSSGKPQPPIAQTQPQASGGETQLMPNGWQPQTNETPTTIADDGQTNEVKPEKSGKVLKVLGVLGILSTVALSIIDNDIFTRSTNWQGFFNEEVSIIICLILATRQSIWLWPVKIIPSIFYIIRCFANNFYKETFADWDGGNSFVIRNVAVETLVLIICIYGFIAWLSHKKRTGEEMPICRASVPHWVILCSVAVIMGAAYYYWAVSQGSSAGIIGTSQTVLSIIAVLMLARKMIEHWIVLIVVYAYWITQIIFYPFYVDIFGLCIYLIFTTAAVIGFIQWRKKLIQKQ